MSASEIKRNLSLNEAYAVTHALDFLSRIGIGQIDRISDLTRMDGALCLKNEHLIPSNQEQWGLLKGITDHVARLLEYPSGGSYGIGHTYVSPIAHRAWEVKKVIDKALAMERNPSPSFRTVDYDGLILRYTKDPAPKAEIIRGEGNESLDLTLNSDQIYAINKALDLIISVYSGDYQAIVRLAEEDFLIPFDAKDQFGRSKYDGRPSCSENQICAMKECMSAYSSTMGFDSRINLNDYEIPKHIQTTLNAQANLTTKQKTKPDEPNL